MNDTPGKVKVPDEDSVEQPTEYNRVDPTDGPQDPLAYEPDEEDDA